MSLLNNLLNNKKLLIFLSVIFIASLIYAVFFAKSRSTTNISTEPATPAKVVVQTDLKPNPLTNDLKRTNIVMQEAYLKITPEVLPLTMPVYKYEAANFVSEANVQKLAQLFNLGETTKNQSAGQGSFLIASNQNGSIVANIENNTFSIEFTKSLQSTSNFKDKNPQIAVDKARAFLTSIGIDIAKYPVTKYVYYTIEEGEGHLEITNQAENALQIQIIFEGQTPNKYPLLDKNFSLKPNQASVTIDADDDILEAAIEDYGGVGEEIENIEIKTKEEVIQELKEGKAQLININSSGSLGDSLTTLVNEIHLGYVVNSGKLVPVFLVKGTASLNGEAAGKAQTEFLIDAKRL